MVCVNKSYHKLFFQRNDNIVILMVLFFCVIEQSHSHIHTLQSYHNIDLRYITYYENRQYNSYLIMINKIKFSKCTYHFNDLFDFKYHRD